jgi:hypothetical protein
MLQKLLLVVVAALATNLHSQSSGTIIYLVFADKTVNSEGVILTKPEKELYEGFSAFLL